MVFGGPHKSTYAKRLDFLWKYGIAFRKLGARREIHTLPSIKGSQNDMSLYEGFITF